MRCFWLSVSVCSTTRCWLVSSLTRPQAGISVPGFTKTSLGPSSITAVERSGCVPRYRSGSPLAEDTASPAANMLISSGANFIRRLLLHRQGAVDAGDVRRQRWDLGLARRHVLIGQVDVMEGRHASEDAKGHDPPHDLSLRPEREIVEHPAHAKRGGVIPERDAGRNLLELARQESDAAGRL